MGWEEEIVGLDERSGDRQEWKGRGLGEGGRVEIGGVGWEWESVGIGVG